MLSALYRTTLSPLHFSGPPNPKEATMIWPPAFTDRPRRLHIAMPLVGLCEKVKYGSIMPHVIEVGVELCLGDV